MYIWKVVIEAATKDGEPADALLFVAAQTLDETLAYLYETYPGVPVKAVAREVPLHKHLAPKKKPSTKKKSAP